MIYKAKQIKEELREIFKNSEYESIKCWIPPIYSPSQEQVELDVLNTLKNINDEMKKSQHSCGCCNNHGKFDRTKQTKHW